MELAFPVTQANAMLTRIRELFDASAAQGHFMTSTYRSGINIKFGQVVSPFPLNYRPQLRRDTDREVQFDDFLSQTSTVPKSDADWSKGTIMFDFPSYLPDSGVRYNEPFCESRASHIRERLILGGGQTRTCLRR